MPPDACEDAAPTHGLSCEEVNALLDAWAGNVALLNAWAGNVALLEHRSSGARSEMVLESALNGRTGALVTFSRPDFEPAARRFGFPLCRPQELLVRLRGHR